MFLRHSRHEMVVEEKQLLVEGILEGMVFEEMLDRYLLHLYLASHQN